MTSAIDRPIRDALAELERRITERVRAQQLTDDLTGLPNAAGLSEAVKRYLDDRVSFWMAFVEVDRFKSINDAWGYELADEVLRAIGDVLLTSRRYFGSDVVAARAHGDEYFLLGRLADSVVEVERNLDLVRRSVEQIRIRADSDGDVIKDCSVSIGWMVNSDLGVGAVQTERAIKEALQRSVDEAKWLGRNTVVRYSTALEHTARVHLREQCVACGCKFDLVIDETKNCADRALACPNCAVEVSRPASAPVRRRPRPRTVPE